MSEDKKHDGKKELTIEDTDEIAQLARLNLSAEEKEKFTKQLNNILGYFEKLNELDTDNIVPRTHPTEMVNCFRDDKVKESLSQDEALSNAPKKKDSYFKAPKIV